MWSELAISYETKATRMPLESERLEIVRVSHKRVVEDCARLSTVFITYSSANVHWFVLSFSTSNHLDPPLLNQFESITSVLGRTDYIRTPFFLS